MRVEVVSTVERPGKSVYEDALCVVDHAGMPFYAAMFDGRRAWEEGGDAEGLARMLNAESTGQAVAQFAREFFLKRFPAWVAKTRQGFWGSMATVGDWTATQRFAYGGPPLAGILAEANKEWGRTVNRRFCYNLHSPEHLPGCAATVIRIDQDRGILKFAHWCDTRIILFSTDGAVFVPTIDNMDRWDRIVLKVACENARVLGTSPRKALYETNYSEHSDLINPIELDTKHRAMENTDHGAGIGVLNGMERAVEFMQVGEIPVGRYEYLLLATDGLSFPTGVDDPYDWEEMVKFLLAHDLSLEALADEIRRREETDMEEFWTYPRFAFHRDATGVLLRLAR